MVLPAMRWFRWLETTLNLFLAQNSDGALAVAT